MRKLIFAAVAAFAFAGVASAACIDENCEIPSAELHAYAYDLSTAGQEDPFHWQSGYYEESENVPDEPAEETDAHNDLWESLLVMQETFVSTHEDLEPVEPTLTPAERIAAAFEAAEMADPEGKLAKAFEALIPQGDAELPDE